MPCNILSAKLTLYYAVECRSPWKNQFHPISANTPRGSELKYVLSVHHCAPWIDFIRVMRGTDSPSLNYNRWLQTRMGDFIRILWYAYGTRKKYSSFILWESSVFLRSYREPSAASQTHLEFYFLINFHMHHF